MMTYAIATMEDLPAIKALLAKYHKDTIQPEDLSGGFVTTKLSDKQFEDLIVNQKGITIAKNEVGEVKAFAFHASWEYWISVPIMKRMTEVLVDMSFNGVSLDTSNTYQYGPVCVDADIRGTGVFAKIFKEALKLYENRYPIMLTFINQINPRSYAAHTKKAGMEAIGEFTFNDNQYWMMAIQTKG